MKKNRMPPLRYWLPAVLFCCLNVMNAEDPFCHFSTSVDKSFPTLRRTVVFKDRFAKNSWHLDGTFPGRLSYDKALVLTPTKRNDKEYGIALKLYRSVYPIDGKKYEFSATLSGHGKAKVGIIIYGNCRNGRPAQRIFWSGECDLGPVAKKVVLDADCSRQRVYQMAFLLHINSGGKLICSEAEFCEISDSSIDIGSPYLLLVKKGDPLPHFHFEVRQTGELKHPMILLSSDERNVNASSTTVADDKGRVYPPQTVVNGKTSCTLSVNGTTSTTYVLPVSSSHYERCNELARNIRLKRPLKIVVLGDSLQDKNFIFNVGCGACEQLFFWLDKYNHNLVSIKNLAVRGDSLQRADQRMQRELDPAKRPVFEQRVYRGMFDDDADIVFIQFGHNDTAFKTSNSEIREYDGISEESISQTLREIIEICRQHWPNAKIIVFSSTSSCESICRQRHRDLCKTDPKRTFSLFGVPACLEAYNMTSKSAALASDVLFYDIYSEMKALPYETKVKLFNQGDGVHLSPEGHVYMTIKYLELLRNITE